MKKHVLLFAGLFLLSLLTIGQSQLNLVIFSEDGDLFYAYVNGVKQNDQAQSNVKITGLSSPNISLRVEFNDKTLPQLKQNMSLEMGYEHTAKIVRDMKKQLKLRYFGQAPIGSSAPANGSTVAYHTADNASSNSSSGSQMSDGNTITTTQTTYNSSTTGNGGNGSVSINMGANGVNMNVNGMDPNGGTMNTTTTTKVTTSSSSSSSSSSGSTSDYGNSQPVQTNNRMDNTCHHAMNAANFGKMKESVQSKPFSDTKMSTAKVATKNACLSVNQIKEICKLFSMDDEKLAYAQFAYDYCVDKANYYQVSEVFSFSTTTDELNKFIEAK